VSAVLRVARAEWGRLLCLRATWLVLLLLAAVSRLRAWVSVSAVAAERVGAGGEDPVSSGLGWAPLVDGWRTGLVLGALVLVAVSARSLAGDHEAGVLRLALTRSAPRGALVWGRLLLSPLLVLATVAATGLAAFAVAGANGDFGPFVEDGYEIFAAEELRAELARSVVAILPALLATYAFGLFVSSLAPGATVAVTAALGVFLAFDLFKDTLGRAGDWVFAKHVPTLADSSAWDELQKVVRGFSDAVLSERLFRIGLVAPLPSILLLGLLASLVLSRRRL